MAFGKVIYNRRDFLQFSSKKSVQLQTNLSLEPLDTPLTLAQVYHLLRRTNFSISYSVAQSFVNKMAHEVVEKLLDNSLLSLNPTPPSWINDGFKSPFGMAEGEEKVKAIRGMLDRIKNQNQELKLWWMKLMHEDTQSIREKMSFFWHGHFTSDSTIPAQYMYRQNQLFRSLHQGSFQEFLEKITLDGAMLIYLNGQDNHRDKPNENYARELLELFTMGIGNYSEWDIREIAKSLTGWRTNYFTDNQFAHPLYKTYLDIEAHDFNQKLLLDEIMKNNYNWTEENVFKYEIQVLMERILKNRGLPTANFMARKFYRFFVYANPNETPKSVIDELANTFIKNKFQIRPVLAQLLKSKHFFDENLIGIQIKSPTEMMLSFSKHFVVDYSYQEKVMTEMGQELLHPPNVSGWMGYRNWINTKTLPVAMASLNSIIDRQTNELMTDWIKQFKNFDNSLELTQAITQLFLSRKITEEVLKKYEQKLLGGSPDYEWATMLKTPATAGLRVKTLMKELIKAPDFYLC